MSDYIAEFQFHRLPEEIVMEIVVRLPSKSLIRMKSVCRAWRSLISDPQFLAKHLLPDRRRNVQLLVKRRHNTNHRDQVFSFLSHQTLRQESPIRPLPYPKLPRVFYPWNPNYLGPEIHISGHCSSNGLICLFDSKHSHIALWSLATGDVKILPDSHVPDPPRAHSRPLRLGYGYDAATDDHKVIRVSYLVRDDYLLREIKVEIYSFKADIWSGTPAVVLSVGIYPSLQDHRYMAYANGYFLWGACCFHDQTPSGYCILWFRMSDESFGTIMFPPGVESVALTFDSQLLPGDADDKPFWETDFFVLNDHTIALVVFDFMRRMHKCFHVWVLLEFGVEDSWTRLFTIGPLVSIQRPLWFWNNGKVIMESTNGDLVLCDPFTNDIEPLSICGLPNSIQILSVESRYICSTYV